MKLITTTILLLFSIICVNAQDIELDKLKKLTESNNYDIIVAEYANNYDKLSAKSLYYIGQAFFMLENDTDCLKFMDLSIQLDNQDPASYFIKASTLNYLSNYEEAITNFEKAILLNPNDEKFYTGLGDSYTMQKNYIKAAESYTKATKLPNCPDRSYYMLGQAYSSLKDDVTALKAFYQAKEKMTSESEYYVDTLFNIGLLESLQKNLDKAEPIFKEIIEISPNDYHSYAKLIQIYYHNKTYDKAVALKKTLYEAHRKGELKETNLEDMFCIDQFEWKGYKVLVFERYENENKGKIYNKHLFYVNDKSEKTMLRVQTEFSPISVELGGSKYLLCANQGATHINSGLGFNEDYNYEGVKTEAINLFTQYLK
ncbi:tetratricopeptide repeat protein [Flavobacterium sp. NKUCC04_CG]|uniref:tetratricopeptide repeat protein n=1 Tax=Flavobacterium sp. NKUCC04_CG TaxID=2842121 RepID=UPI001C5BEAAD|nr:tetratricopeptide repeat protein [Flavobacterium sp. NKUCC04_CG]MBW3518635.1 tetratricopeptide repeat protein [Flavobacterium sp. NKUCC04_CG]